MLWGVLAGMLACVEDVSSLAACVDRVLERYALLLKEQNVQVDPEVPVNVLHFTINKTTSNDEVRPSSNLVPYAVRRCARPLCCSRELEEASFHRLIIEGIVIFQCDKSIVLKGRAA